jgi:hypothetical protein
MRPHCVFAMTLLATLAGSVSPAYAQRGKIARELAEAAMRRFGKGVAREGSEALGKRLAATAARHGDDLVMGAFRKIGPRALSIADDAGEKIAPRALRFIGRHGDDAAAVLTKRSMKLLSLGDDAAEMLIKHKGVSTPLLEAFGTSATKALTKIKPQNGRRLAMLTDSLLKARRAVKLLEVIEKYGDPAMDWIWKNKVPLAATAAMTAFLANPEPFIKGTRQLTETLSKEVMVPLAGVITQGGAQLADSLMARAVTPVVTEVSREAARRIPWAPAAIAAAILLGGLTTVTLRRLLPRRPLVAIVATQQTPAGSS